ncbi:MAG: IS630 family transposase, partial [Rickettsia endosymbiont of Bryobia graminum]|nr:IS630 family transposase [Rickettsia endosymbiont of Bryobia graminum]
MSQNVLTEEQREKLKERHKTERDGRIGDRIKAVLMYNAGYSNVEISKVLLLSHEAKRKHIIDYQKANKLNTENVCSARKLNDIEKTELEAHLEEKTYVYGKEIVHS